MHFITGFAIQVFAAVVLVRINSSRYSGPRNCESSIAIATAKLFTFLEKDWQFDDVIPAPKKPLKLPVVLSPEEVMQFLDCVDGAKHRAILTTCHAAGLRISEVICLKTDNIDSQRMVIRVDQGKGQKDRYVMLSPTLLEILRSWWRMNKPRHWLFPSDLPGQHISKDAVELACQKARRLSGIRKPITNSIGSLIQSHAMLPKQRIAGLCYLPTDTAEINCPSALKELTGCQSGM